MDKTFNISVKSKQAKNLSKIPYVCGNTDYRVAFDFDDDWDKYPIKTARFVAADGKVYEKTVTDGSCDFPQIMDTFRAEVGVYAGELATTTPAVVECLRSIRSGTGDTPEVPEPDRYDQMMEAINADAVRAEEAAQGAKASATEAKEAAEEAREAAENAKDTDILVVRVISSGTGYLDKVDHTGVEIKQAAEDGKMVFLIDPYKRILTYYGVEKSHQVNEKRPVFIGHFKYEDKAFKHVRVEITKDDGYTLSEQTVYAPTPFKLNFTGAVNETFNGSKEVTIPIHEGGGGGSVKQINGQHNTDGTVTFDMPLADMYALGAELAEYDIGVTYYGTRYRVYRVTVNTGEVLLYCSAIDNYQEGIDLGKIYLRETEAILSNVTHLPLYDLPTPRGNVNMYLGTDDSGNYVLKDTPMAVLPMLNAVEMDGTIMFLSPDTGDPVIITMDMLSEMYGDNLANLKVTMINMETQQASMYGFAFLNMSEDPENPPYILFNGDNGKVIRMDADGTLSYVKDMQLATQQYVQDAIQAKAENAGKLLYVSDDGTLQPLTLGTGLSIVDGLLTISASAARAVAGMALAGQVKVGEV